MACTHREPERWEWVDEYDDYTGEIGQRMVRVGGESTDVDLDIGRFRCSQCGRVGYYTGQWKRFYEEGVPCVGSDNIRRP